MGQNSGKNVSATNNSVGTKSYIKLCQFFLSLDDNKGLTKYELAREFDIPKDRIGNFRKLLYRHRRDLPCLAFETGTKFYTHDKNKCRLQGQNKEGLVKQNVPPKIATSPGLKDQVISSNNFVIAWLSDKFHISKSIVENLLEFTWRDQIIEIHGAIYDTFIDYRPKRVKEFTLPRMKCNNYASFKFQVAPNGKLTGYMGPVEKKGPRAKYGFSPFGVPLSKFEAEAEKFIKEEINEKVILRNRIILCDLAVDNHRVHSCLNRDPVPIEVDGKEIMLGQEYMVVRGEDHPHYHAEDFIPGQKIRRQEIRFLKREALEFAPFVIDLMRRSMDDIESGFHINAMKTEMSHLIKQQKYSQDDLREIGVNINYSNNMTQQGLMRLDEGQSQIKSGIAETYVMGMKTREDIDIRSNYQDNKLNRINGDVANLSDQVTKSNSDLNSNLAVMIAQNDTRNDLLRDNNELQIINMRKLEGIHKLLSEIKEQQLQNTNSEVVKWQKIDSGTKLFMIATLYKLQGSFEKVALEIQKEFKVTRQALDKLIRSRTKNWEMDLSSKIDKLLASIDISKVARGGTISNNKKESSNLPYTDTDVKSKGEHSKLSNNESGTIKGTKILFSNLSYTDNSRIEDRMKKILEIATDKPNLSRKQLSKLAGGSNDRTLMLIQYLVDNGYLISTSPNPARPKWTKIKRSDKKL